MKYHAVHLSASVTLLAQQRKVAKSLNLAKMFTVSRNVFHGQKVRGQYHRPRKAET